MIITEIAQNRIGKGPVRHRPYKPFLKGPAAQTRFGNENTRHRL